MNKIRVLVADDHQMFRTGVVHVLESSNEYDIVGEAGNGKEAIDQVKQCQPDIILMDIDLPLLNGISSSKRILNLFPKVKILALSHSSDQRCIINMIQAGASGYVLKEGTMDELKMAIKTLAKGGSYFSRDISSTLFTHLKDNNFKIEPQTTGLEKLTGRELEILKFVSEEFSNQEIARQLFISPRTVETHKRNLIQKLKVKNAIGLVKYYLKIIQKKDLIDRN